MSRALLGGRKTMSIILKKQRALLFASAARGATAGTQSDFIPCEPYNTASLMIRIGATSGTPDSFTFDMKLQGSMDGSSWVDLPNGAITQVTSATQFVMLKNIDISGFIQLRTTHVLAFVNGTAPKLTFDTNLIMTQAQSVIPSAGAIDTKSVGCNVTVYDVATDADVVISSAPCLLLGLYVNTVLSAHAVNVQDNSTVKMVLPASMAAGSKIDCHGAKFLTNLTMNSNDAATGQILVFWRLP